jgi:flagellar protein FlbD
VIVLSRLNGQLVAINPDLVTWIEVLPDTTISMVTGEKILVRESLDEVIGRVIAFRSSFGKIESIKPGMPVAAIMATRHGHSSQQRTSNRPPPPRSIFPALHSEPPPPPRK